MKKIYTFTLDDDVPLSDNTISDIKQIAYCLFEEIDQFDLPILAVNDKKKPLIKNELLESYNGIRYNYRFESENSKFENYRYDPLLISNNSFGITVYDDSVTDEQINSFLNKVQFMLGLNYKFNIDNIYYDDEIVNGRLAAYNFLMTGSPDIDNKESSVKVKKKARVLTKPLLSIFYF